MVILSSYTTWNDAVNSVAKIRLGRAARIVYEMGEPYDFHQTRHKTTQGFAMIRRTLYEVVLVVLITLALSTVAYVLHPQALPLWPSEDRPSGSDDTNTDYRAISMDRAVALFNQKQAEFADARPRHAFVEGHIKGAVHLDPYQFDEWSEALVAELPPDATIITYCDGIECPLSSELAERLTWLGYENVFYLKDGWGLWKQQGLPVAQGE